MKELVGKILTIDGYPAEIKEYSPNTRMYLVRVGHSIEWIWSAKIEQAIADQFPGEFQARDGKLVILGKPHPGPPPKFPEPETDFTEEGILKAIPTPEELNAKSELRSEQDNLAFADKIVSSLFSPTNWAKFPALGEVSAIVPVNPGDSVEGGIGVAERLMARKGWSLSVTRERGADGLSAVAYRMIEEDEVSERQSAIAEALFRFEEGFRVPLAEIDEEAS